MWEVWTSHTANADKVNPYVSWTGVAAWVCAPMRPCSLCLLHFWRLMSHPKKSNKLGVHFGTTTTRFLSFCFSVIFLKMPGAVCCRLCRYFDGRHHLEEMMFYENIRRSQLLIILDKFYEVLVISHHEEPNISYWLYSWAIVNKLELIILILLLRKMCMVLSSWQSHWVLHRLHNCTGWMFHNALPSNCAPRCVSAFTAWHSSTSLSFVCQLRT